MPSRRAENGPANEKMVRRGRKMVRRTILFCFWGAEPAICGRRAAATAGRQGPAQNVYIAVSLYPKDKTRRVKSKTVSP